MKKLILSSIVLLGLVFCVNAQTEASKKAITSSYNQQTIKEFAESLKQNNIKNQKEIAEYLEKNPSVQKTFEGSDGSISEIKYIINNTPIYVTTDNANCAIATRANFLNPGGALGLNLEGQNMHVATWDGGPTLTSHQEFQDDSFNPISRVTAPDATPSNDQSNHSTHVSGTIIAKGVSPAAKGMAPKATLTSYDWDFDDSEALNEATTNALLLSNHSYGIPTQTNSTFNYLMGSYNVEAYTWDNIAYNAPYYLQVVSAGNDGTTTYSGGLRANYDKLVGNKNSKNNLVVANAATTVIHPNGSGELLSLFINSSSSQGPTDDGRIKPDITADGTSVYSPISTSDSSYATYSGTSMAAPNTTGTLLLLQQYYNQLNAQYMKSATLKGLVCHTADDDSQSPGPDAIYGWGLLNAKAAAEAIEGSQTGNALVVERVLSQGETFTYNFTAGSGSELSATICWTDVPGTPTDVLNSPVSRLVNDLDLRISDGTTTHMPWKLDLANVQAYAQKGDNLVDTVENVDIANPTAGNYTITVTHKGTLSNGPQAYSLIITGANLVLGQSDLEKETGFLLWPNPVNDVLNYRFNNNGALTTVKLTDVQGRVIYQNSYEVNSPLVKGEINTNSYAKGLYFMSIQQGNSNLTKKVILK